MQCHVREDSGQCHALPCIAGLTLASVWMMNWSTMLGSTCKAAMIKHPCNLHLLCVDTHALEGQQRPKAQDLWLVYNLNSNMGPSCATAKVWQQGKVSTLLARGNSCMQDTCDLHLWPHLVSCGAYCSGASLHAPNWRGDVTCPRLCCLQGCAGLLACCWRSYLLEGAGALPTAGPCQPAATR